MKALLFTVAALILVACSDDKTYLNDQSGRIKELERRADLNDQLNVLQNQRLDALELGLQLEEAARIAGDADLSDQLQQEIDARIAADSVLADLIADEEAARIAGDLANANALSVEISNRIAGDNANSAALAFAMFLQSITNFSLQQQINLINNKLLVVNTKLNSLQSQVNNLDVRIDNLESDVSDLQQDMASLQASLQAQINSLSMQQAATQAQLDREGVKLFKCNASNSTERIMKINNKFYAVMNRVTTDTVQVITGSSSTSFSNPKLCLKDEKVKLPGGNGQCPNSWDTVGGNTVSVPSYSTANKTVVTSVKIALDVLTDGSYQTTDGGPACTFTISGGGTTSTNLVSVQ